MTRHREIARPYCEPNQQKTIVAAGIFMNTMGQVDPCRIETYNPAGIAAGLAAFRLYDTDENYWNGFIPP